MLADGLTHVVAAVPVDAVVVAGRGFRIPDALGAGITIRCADLVAVVGVAPLRRTAVIVPARNRAAAVVFALDVAALAQETTQCS